MIVYIILKVITSVYICDKLLCILYLLSIIFVDTCIDYWHQTMNLDTPSISIGSTLITESSVHIICNELIKECNGQNRIFPPDEVLCKAITHCYIEWNKMFEL